jgi:DNA-binding PadR family transcriptional regulator
MLDMAILGLLEERDLHGYEIRRQLRDNLGILANVSFGSIYPALTRLEKAGAVMATEGPLSPVGSVTRSNRSAAPQAPPTGSLSGELAVLRARRHSTSHSRRGKKVYRITDKGRQLFVQLLADPGSLDDARSFGLRLAFARHLAPQARLALLERRRAQLVQRLAEAEGTNVELDVYARSVVQHTADSVAQDITWLDRLIASERAIPQASEHADHAVHSGHATPIEHAVPQSVPTELTYEGDIR